LSFLLRIFFGDFRALLTPGENELMGLTDSARELFSKLEVLKDLEGKVRELMESHERKRDLWYPSELIGPRAGDCPDTHYGQLRKRASGIPDPARAALALNLLTEEGLPHFHRLLAVYLGDDSFWRLWNNLWTAEEDRHGQVLHDYAREARLLNQRTLEEMQFEYIKAGFHPEWDRDPYRVFAYTTVQERATQHSHAETGKLVGEYEPILGEILSNVAKEEARHYTFYRTVFEEILKRDPDQALHAASFILPSIDMPGHTMPGFRDLADVIRRAGIYGPRDYLRIVQEQIRYWQIESLDGLSELGRKAQEKIMSIPERLRRVCDIMETRSRAKTFSFEVVFNREFAME
jgi:acyl-[acyl-carrier-protein] desaturase